MHDPEQIRQQAKKIMDEFIAALDAVADEEIAPGIERAEGVRMSGKRTVDPAFKDRMLKNAPKVKGDYLMAEKRQW